MWLCNDPVICLGLCLSSCGLTHGKKITSLALGVPGKALVVLACGADTGPSQWTIALGHTLYVCGFI